MLSVIMASWALFIGILFMMISNGLHGTLLGVRAGIEEFPTQITGLVMAGYFGGFFAGSLLVPRLLSLVGHIRVYAALASIASVAVLVQAVWVDPWPWLAMRLVTGFSFAGLYIVCESWLNDVSTNRTRGTILSIYLVLNYIGIVVGQLLIDLADPRETTLFILVSALVSIALVPVLLTVAPAPNFTEPKRLGILELYRISPLGVVGSGLVGVANGAIVGFGAVFAQSAGLKVDAIGYMLAAAFLGGAITQMPVGRLSDFVDRRYVIVGCGALAAGSAVFGAISMATSTFWMIAGFVSLCAFSLPLYSLCVAQANDHLEPKQMVAASGVLVLVGGVGAVFGPIISALSMEQAGPVGYLWWLCVIHVVIAVYALYRRARREGVSAEERVPYSPATPRPTPVGQAIRQRAVRDAMDRDLSRLI